MKRSFVDKIPSRHNFIKKKNIQIGENILYSRKFWYKEENILEEKKSILSKKNILWKKDNILETYRRIF